MDQQISEDRVDFRQRRGTREDSLALRMILKQRLDKNQNTIVAFNDLEKVIDMVN